MARRRPATSAESSTCWRGNAVGLTSILDRGRYTARRYASAVYAVTVCPSVRLSVCHKSVFYQDG